MLNTLKALVKDDEGATLVEYALVIALIAIFCIVVLTQLGKQVSTEFSTISTNL
jgi:pilus assembly protein Flp/PilA